MLSINTHLGFQTHNSAKLPTGRFASTLAGSLLLAKSQPAAFYWRTTFQKYSQFFSLRPNPDRPKIPKLLLIVTILGFPTHVSPELSA